MSEWIAVEGLDQLNRTLRKAADGGLVKAVGRANKRVGAQVIERWLRPRPTPAAVGRGAGSKVRPSAKKRELIVRAGGAHRAGNVPYMQWGKRQAREPGEPARDRPYIQRSVWENRDEIYKLWLDEISDELAGAGGLDGT